MNAVIAALLLLAICCVAQAQSTQCPNDCSQHGQCYGTLCQCSFGWAGNDCSIADTAIQFNVPVSGSVATYAYQYYHLNVNANTGSFTVIVNQTSSNTDCDGYVLKGSYPSTTHYSVADASTNPNFAMVVPNASPGMWYIGIYGFIGCSFQLQAVASGCPNGCSGHGICQQSFTCQCNSGYTGNDCSTPVTVAYAGENYNGNVLTSQWNYFSYSASAGSQLLFEVTQNNGVFSGDCDLYIGFQSIPTLLNFSYANATTASYTSVVVPNTHVAGVFYAGIFGFSSCSYLFKITASSSVCAYSCTNRGSCVNGMCSCPSPYNGTFCENMVAPLQPYVPVTGSVSTGAFNRYTFTMNTQSPAVLQVVQTSGVGDSDIYVRANAPATLSSFDYANTSVQPTYNLYIPNPSSITWFVSIYGYSGSVSYTLLLNSTAGCNCGPNGNCSSVPGVCQCNPGWAGGICSRPVALLASGSPTSNANVTARGWVFYSFVLPSSSSLAVVTLQEPNTAGYLGLYVNLEDVPSLLSYQYANATLGQRVHQVTIQAGYSHSDTTYYVGVYGGNYSPTGMSIAYQLVAWVAPF